MTNGAGMNRFIAMLLGVMLAAPGGAFAANDNAVARMQAFLRQVHSLKADFTQVVLDANLQTVKQSSGTLALKRPNRFRWDYAAPNREIIDADGTRVWMYDVELQQVTVKPLTGTLAASPAVLLAGSNDVQQNFIVKSLGVENNLEWVGVTPKVKDTDFDSVKLGFRGNLVAVMELKDALGNLTRITFSHVQVNPELPDSLFMFTPPPGADVIGDAGKPGS